MCVCVGVLGLLTCICEIYIGFQITLSLRITLVSKAVFVSVFAYLIFALAVKFYHFIFFFFSSSRSLAFSKKSNVRLLKE